MAIIMLTEEEGKTVEVEYRGKADDTIKDILSGIRSACTYVGATRLKTLSKCTTLCVSIILIIQYSVQSKLPLQAKNKQQISIQ